jgi:hypothetical protein
MKAGPRTYAEVIKAQKRATLRRNNAKGSPSLLMANRNIFTGKGMNAKLGRKPKVYTPAMFAVGGRNIFSSPAGYYKNSSTAGSYKKKASPSKKKAYSPAMFAVGGRNLFAPQAAPKNPRRVAAAKARAPAKGSPEAMAIGARLRAAKMAKK